MNQFNAELERHTDELGYRLELITPADEPTAAIVSRGEDWLHVSAEGVAPAVPEDTLDRAMHVPDLVPELVISRADEANAVVGRAGMRYRDLIPGRLGGRFIGSHIEVCDGGPVPDLVHHHAIRFQMIFCHRGWVDVVYEDQGPAFRMEAGDGVLQPSGIRHRVLASSAGAQVVEIGCPASHDTFFDYDLPLPNEVVDRDRKWNGQRFVRHVGADTEWRPSRHHGFEAQHSGIAEATDGLASVRFLRAAPGAEAASFTDAGHDGEFWFLFVFDGTARFQCGEADMNVAAGDAVTIPPGCPWSISDASDNLCFLEVTLPD